MVNSADIVKKVIFFLFFVPFPACQVWQSWKLLKIMQSRPLTTNLRWRPFSSVSHVSDRLELHNNNRASWILHPGPSESDVYSDVFQEAQWNDLLHTARLLMRLDTPLHGNNARGAKYAVYYASVATHTVFENIKMAALRAMSEEKCCSPFPCFFIPCAKVSSPVPCTDSPNCWFLCWKVLFH